jgi:hypothetical protein
VGHVEFGLDPSIPVERVCRVDFIDQVHRFPVCFGYADGFVVEARSRDAQQLTLSHDRQRGILLDQPLSLIRSEGPTAFF